MHRFGGAHEGAHASGKHAVDADAVRRQLDRQRAHEADKPVLGCGVVRDARVAAQGCGGADKDDAPSLVTLDHSRNRGSTRRPGSFEVGPNHLVPLRLTQRPGPSEVDDAGVGADDVESTQLRRRGGNRLHLLDAGGVRLPHQAAAAGLPHQPRHLLQVLARAEPVWDRRLVVAEIAGDDVRPRLRQRDSLSAPLAPPGTGHHGDATRQSGQASYGSRIGSSSESEDMVASGATPCGTWSFGSSTARMPRALAPPMSSTGRSPTITASAGATPRGPSTARKASACGLVWASSLV